MPAQNNLPVHLTTFVGRKREIAELNRLLSTSRLVTLTGAGGVGKSRLALQVAMDLLDAYPDGVCWTELAPLADPGLVHRAVATAVGIAEHTGRPLDETLPEFLGSKTVLLVLDNCEHLVAACAALAGTLLRRCPRLRIVSTSRESLGLAGELSYRVPSLSLPDMGRLPAAPQLIQCEAIRLFVDRAKLADPRFELTSNNAAAVAQICARLDGMPLALELAAARVPVLAVEQIAKRLDDRFRLLVGGGRESLARHQTLRAALDWSYALLSEKERTVLARLSVFAGGWTLEAAEAICADGSVDGSEVLDLLAQLVRKSFVAMEPLDNAARYRLLETVRQYARDTLRASGSQDGVFRRHRDFFLMFAEGAVLHMLGPDSAVWLRAVEDEHDNLRGAFAWSREIQDRESAARLAVALTRFFILRGHVKQGWEWLTSVLTPDTALPASLRGQALSRAAGLAFVLGDHRKAVALGEDALAVLRRLGDASEMVQCFRAIGFAHMASGDYARAAAGLDDAMRLCKEVGDDVLYADTLRQRGHLEARKGNYVQASAMLNEAISRMDGLGYARGAAYARRHLGLVKLYQDEFKSAETLLKQSLAQFEVLDDKEGAGAALSALATLLRRKGELEQATACYRRSLTAARELGVNWGIIECLFGFAAIAARRRPQYAARLLGAAEHLCDVAQYALPHAEQLDYDRIAGTMKRALGETAYGRAIAEGRAMPLERAIEHAVLSTTDAEPEPPWPQAGASAVAERGVGDKHGLLLTRREREVAALVAQGLTNREIASRLVITEKTVDAHVQNILNKLGARSRTQIALWSAEHVGETSGPD